MFPFWRHPEARVVACVLAAVVAGEAGMRLYGDRLSKDIRHLEEFDEIAARIAAPAQAGETRVLFLGNSLTRFGVDPEEFARAAAETGLGPVRVERMMPDNTALADWSYAYRAFLAGQDRRPDLLVIGFQGGHLRDARSHHPERLARYYARWEDLPELFQNDLPTFEARAGFGAAGASALLCNRDRIESRVLDRLIPGYQDNIQILNRRVQGTPSSQPAAPSTYLRLQALLETARAQGVQVVLAAMPIPDPYEIDPELPGLAQQHGAALVDCRRVPGIAVEMFPDGLHMNADASRLYTRFLAEQLDGRALMSRTK